MKSLYKNTTWAWFVGGVSVGLLVYHSAIWLNGQSVVSRISLEQKQTLIAELQQENRELTDELFKPRVRSDSLPEGGDLPYDAHVDAHSMVASARKEALTAEKFLMVTFGANWCMDCRTLHRNLKSENVAKYTSDLFLFINVDVGKFNQNADLATELGVTLSNGIPVAVFFDPAGQVIGTTNEGQLEPARRYSSKQILKFVRDIAERSQIMAPDAVTQ
jgi:thioredoxin 1